MIIKQIYTNCLSQASYYIESKGESIIIDPIRDIEGYDELINKNNSELKFILETHFHADFISGHIELSNKYNVPIIFGPHADTNFNSINKEDGEIIKLGDIQIKVIHTPGHTLESVCYLLFDEKNNQKCLFTGDTLFIGDIGRPDLAVDNNLSVNDLASMLYDSLYDKIMKLDEKIIIYPAHGPGTQCGKNLSEETFSTLKEQKLSNYALMFNNKTDFVSSITKNLPPAPDYFRDSALLNKNGYKSYLYDFDSLLISDFNLFKDENVNLIDTRDPILFSKQHVKNSINVPLNGRYAITAANILDVKKKLIIICNEGDENESITRLRRVGFENIIGFYNKNLNIVHLKPLISKFKSESSEYVHKYKGYKFIDVRTENEYNSKHVKSSINIPLFDLEKDFSKLDMNDNYMIYCRSGYRSSVASSILMKNNIKNLINIKEGIIGLAENKNVNFN